MQLQFVFKSENVMYLRTVQSAPVYVLTSNSIFHFLYWLTESEKCCYIVSTLTDTTWLVCIQVQIRVD